MKAFCGVLDGERTYLQSEKERERDDTFTLPGTNCMFCMHCVLPFNLGNIVVQTKIKHLVQTEAVTMQGREKSLQERREQESKRDIACVPELKLYNGRSG